MQFEDCAIIDNYIDLCDQLVNGQLGLIKKITVKDAWVNSGATGLPHEPSGS